MLAKLEECSLLNKKDNLGNAALKQGKKFNKYSGIVKSNRKIANKSNKVKNDFSLDGYLIEGFEGEGGVTTALNKVTTALSDIHTISNPVDPPLPPRYGDGSLNDISENISLDNLRTPLLDIGLKNDNYGRYTDNNGIMINGAGYTEYNTKKLNKYFK